MGDTVNRKRIQRLWKISLNRLSKFRGPFLKDLIDDFDPELLGYAWRHRDPRVDALQAVVQESIRELGGKRSQPSRGLHKRLEAGA